MRHLPLVAAVLLVTAACSDDSTGPSTSLTSEQRADVAAAVGEATATDVDAMSRSGTSSSVLFGFGGALDNGVCTSVLGNLVCTATAGNLSGEATLTFRDGSGQTQTAYDASTTASVLIDTDISGDVTRSGFTLDLDHQGSFTVTGLAGTETTRTWNGTGTTNIASSLFGGARAYEFTSNSNFQAVVVPTSGDEPRWPTSGRVTSTVQLEFTGGVHDGERRSTTVQIDFNGTANVPMRVGSTAFRLDLATHLVTTAS
ncbi:MAG TPA: hypothetical protein VFN22_09760 [Gemmatimonadales bacterium]|nr:hypothetical protein [Gemmatimonadales bacterium]